MVNSEWNTSVDEWNDYNDYKYITHWKGSGQYLLRLMIALITHKHQFVKVEKNSVEFFQVKSESFKIMGIKRMFDAWCLMVDEIPASASTSTTTIQSFDVQFNLTVSCLRDKNTEILRLDITLISPQSKSLKKHSIWFFGYFYLVFHHTINNLISICFLIQSIDYW